MIDWTFGMLSLIPFWNGQPVLGVVLACAPSVIGSSLVLTFADLASYKHTSLRAYLSQHMGAWSQGARVIGFICMMFGAAIHDVLLILAGAAFIMLVWLNTYFFSHMTRTVRTLRFKNTIPSNLPR
jgi:hypothetical protein